MYVMYVDISVGTVCKYVANSSQVTADNMALLISDSDHTGSVAPQLDMLVGRQMGFGRQRWTKLSTDDSRLVGTCSVRWQLGSGKFPSFSSLLPKQVSVFMVIIKKCQTMHIYVTFTCK